MIKIIHYRNNCIGCDACIQEAPDYWEMNYSDGMAILKNAEIKKEIAIARAPACDYWQCMRAAESCPVQIIKIIKIKP